MLVFLMAENSVSYWAELKAVDLAVWSVEYWVVSKASWWADCLVGELADETAAVLVVKTVVCWEVVKVELTAV